MRIFFLLCLCLSFFISESFAAINYTVTPIKYELELQPGESITLPASIRNNGDETVTLPTTASDFQTNSTSGVPNIVRKSELVYPDQQLSSWISIEDSSITMAAGQEETTNFTIDVPTTATPGGHYGAVLFNNRGSETSTSGNIGINVDYGILILVNVSGEVYVEIEIETPLISGNSGRVTYDRCDGNDTSGSIYDGTCGNGIAAGSEQKDVCALGDFTPSRYDGKCFGPTNPGDTSNENPQESGSGASPDIEDKPEFNVDFTFPINNTGNTHVKPTGKIVLKDEDGNILKAIGKETISNDRGAVIGEKIVDYIPINDQGGNVLPSSQRIFTSEWKGFPYKSYDDEGNQVMNYWDPSEYYTKKNKQDAGFLMFWERVSESRTYKTITAEIEIIYYDEKGNPIEFTSAQEFPVQYVEEVVSLNPYIILALLLLFTALLFLWFGLRWWILLFKRNKCWNCKEKIKSHWETCPHCSVIQDKKKHKSYEELKEKEKKTPIKRKTPVAKKTTDKKTAAKKTAAKK